MSHYETFKSKMKSENPFEAVDTQGSFDFFTSIVSLDALNQSHIINFTQDHGDYTHLLIDENSHISPELYADLCKIVPLAIHELAHFVDSTSTLWGLRHLQLMKNAYECDDRKGGVEADFHKAKTFSDHLRSLRLPTYYTLRNEDVPNTRPWQSRISIGKVFDSRGKLSEKPVLFSRFSNSEGQLLVRSPISMVSLLEASAMAQELRVSAFLLSQCEPNFYVVESARFARETLNYLYDPSITEYSVCVHVIANMQQCADAASAFTLCEKIVALVLNFPESMWRVVLESCDLAQVLNIPAGHAFENSFRSGLASQDRGILYYLLCAAVPKNSLESLESLTSGVAAALHRLGIDKSQMLIAARAEAEMIASELFSSRIESIRKLASAGINNFHETVERRSSATMSKLHLPEVYLGDGTGWRLYNNENNVLADLSVDQCFNELHFGESWVHRFAEACV